MSINGAIYLEGLFSLAQHSQKRSVTPNIGWLERGNTWRNAFRELLYGYCCSKRRGKVNGTDDQVPCGNDVTNEQTRTVPRSIERISDTEVTVGRALPGISLSDRGTLSPNYGSVIIIKKP